MEHDCYQIEVLHYLNPHLIWVEVVEKSKQDFVFEQIGIYGVLPYETTIDGEGDGLKAQRCEKWAGASVIQMKKSFSDAKEVWFRPTFIDRRTSIFDDNIHKYGEIIIISRDGKHLELSKILTNSGFALFDTGLFHQELSLGNFKTKMSYVQTQEIIKNLEKDTRRSSKKHKESIVKKQTTVFHEAQNLESMLTEKNLRKHDGSVGKIDVLLEMKSKDFDLCKDVDEQPVGRANSIKNEENNQNVKQTYSSERISRLMLANKKMELWKNQKAKSTDPLQVLLATKKYLEQNAKTIQKDTDSNNSQSTEKNDREQKRDFVSNQLKHKLNHDDELDGNKLDDFEMLNKKERYMNEKASISNDSRNDSLSGDLEEYSERQKNLRSRESRRRTPSRKNKIPEPDLATEKRVAYGPPGFNPSALSLKIVPKEIPEDDFHLVSNKTEEKFEEPRKSLDLYADVDSNIEIEITNKDVLMENFNILNTENVELVHNDSLNHSNQTIKSDTLSNNSLNHLNPTNVSSTDSPLPKSTLSVLQRRLKLHKDIKARNRQESDTLPNNSLNHLNPTNESSTDSPLPKSTHPVLQRKLKLLKDIEARNREDSSNTSTQTYQNSTITDSTTSNEVKRKNESEIPDSDDEDIRELLKKINLEYKPKSIKKEMEKRKPMKVYVKVKNNVNPFKNVDPYLSVFVDKLVAPVLMVHNKMDWRIEPTSSLRDVPFNTNIHVVLKNLGVEAPMMLQMVSWPVILRGFSLFMIAPLGGGKTFGYLPAVCRLVTDNAQMEFVDSVGPNCIIVCATAQSVCEVEHYARMFLGLDEKVVACFAGIDDLDLTTSLLNGCNLFICTPLVLVRLLQMPDFGIDLRRLTTFVLEDCERLSEVYASEVKYFIIKIREMLKIRTDKVLKVQFVVASRVWCGFMESLAKWTPNSVVCIGAFQECVLYSKTNMSVDFLKKENKINKVLEFLQDIDGTKKTVIICRSNDEVNELRKVLTMKKYIVFDCDDTMTVEDLYNLNQSWAEYQEPISGPILVCCDGNLNHLNVTDAHYLVHYSLPHLFSMFCKRFSVLNDNYASIFKENNESLKIKVFLEDSNAEQLPKILNFVKRCTDKLPEFLDDVCEKVLREKDLLKASKLYPICDNMLAFGECPDFWNCQERHTAFEDMDQPKEWMPRCGVVTFKILHYHTPVRYSARLLSSTSNGNTKKYPPAYSTLSIKMGTYYSKESNRKLQGIPNVGDVCAVSVKQNFYVRCQVVKILTRYNNGTPNCVLIKLIDEEKLEKTRDIYLFHLPEELKKIETHVVQVRLANVCPKDKDVTFSELAKDVLKKITAADDDLYIRAKILLTVGNCIMVDTLEACQELTSLNETVVMHNLKKELLDTHAIVNPEHIVKLEKLCEHFIVKEDEIKPQIETVEQTKENVKPQWAHIESDDTTAVYFGAAENPGTFFIRLVKFDSCMESLIKDIAKYLDGKPKHLERVAVGDMVLAKFPDDSVYERARIGDIVNEKYVKCFFVDQGDWRDVQIKDLVKIPTKFVTQIPFQAIECRLVAVQPPGDNWTEFGTNWFCDYFFDAAGFSKTVYVKYFTKENPRHTEGHKYGVAIIDTNTVDDIIINQLMIELNLAQEKHDEFGYIEKLAIELKNKNQIIPNTIDSDDEFELEDLPTPDPVQSTSLVPVTTKEEDIPKSSLDNVFLKKPIRSVPLVDSDNESLNDWDICNPQDLVAILKGVTSVNTNTESTTSSNGGTSVRNQNVVQKTNDNNNLEKKVIDPTLNEAEPTKVPSVSVKKDPENDIQNKVITEVAINDDQSDISISKPTKLKMVKESNSTLDSDDLSSIEGSQISDKPKGLDQIVLSLPKDNAPPVDLHKIDELRKPKLLWRQNKTSVSIKIQLIGAEKYNIQLIGRTLKFDAICNDVKYGFEFELYGVVTDMVHSNKGQYILVKVIKVMKRNWLTLTKDSTIRRWILYDVDSIDTSSDEEDDVRNDLAEIVKHCRDNQDQDMSSDDDFLDDIDFEYKRDF